MGWKRKQFDKKQRLKKTIKTLEASGIDTSRIHMISANADNRHYCWGCCKEKYCYETKEKAEKATRFVSNKQRVYYCELCMAYHTTSILSLPNLKEIRNGFNNKEVLSSGEN